MKMVSFRWVIVAFVAPMIAWGLTLIFGQGAWWESARLDLDKLRTSVELREKKISALQEILTMDRSNAAVLNAKIEYLNAVEKSLAHLEERSPVFFEIKVPATPVGLQLKVERATPNKLEDQPKNNDNQKPEQIGVP